MSDNQLVKRLSPEQCRERAKECTELSRLAEVEAHAIMLQHMAETWERIANDVADNKLN